MKFACEIIYLGSEVQGDPAYLELLNVALYFQPLRRWESDCLKCSTVSRVLSMGLAFLYLAGRSRIGAGGEKLQMNNLEIATHF